MFATSCSVSSIIPRVAAIRSNVDEYSVSIYSVRSCICAISSWTARAAKWLKQRATAARGAARRTAHLQVPQLLEFFVHVLHVCLSLQNHCLRFALAIVVDRRARPAMFEALSVRDGSNEQAIKQTV